MLIPILGYYNPAKYGKQVVQIWNKHNLFDIFTYEVEGNVVDYIFGYSPRTDLMDILFYHIKTPDITLQELFEEFMDTSVEFQKEYIPENVKLEDLIYCPLSKIPLVGASLKF